MIDPAGREYFYGLIKKLVRDGRTVIQITHSAEDAAHSPRCIVLNKGVVTYDGPHCPAPDVFTSSLCTSSYSTKPVSGESQSPPCISFDHVSHVYFAGTGREHTALDDVSLNIGQNESVAIVGATGCGKTTVLKHINALLLPTAGRVAVFDKDTLDRKTSLPVLRRRVCLALQSPETALFKTHVADDVAYGARNIGLKGGPLIDRVCEVMDDVGLPFDEFADRETSTLSGGEARLAALAGVFVLDGDIILLDEPTAGLDTEHSARVLGILEELKRRGKTIVVSTHSLEFASYFDRIIMMAGGRPVGQTSGPEDQDANLEKPPDYRGRLRKTGLEFFRGMAFGIFRGEDSPLRRLSAGVKLPAAALCVIAAAVVPGVVFPVSLFAALLAVGRVWGKIRPIHLVRGLLPLLPILAVFMGIRLLFSWSGDTSRVLLRLGIITVTAEEVSETVTIILHLFTMLAALTLYMSVTSLRETLNTVKRLFSAFASRHKSKEGQSTLARDAGLVLGIALRFVPLITAEAEHIASSQISRGAKTSGFAKLSALKAMIVPLFLRSLERAQILAKAMLLRRYR
jgi:energy-coupling factor transport system ATP-binding protein